MATLSGGCGVWGFGVGLRVMRVAVRAFAGGGWSGTVGFIGLFLGGAPIGVPTADASRRRMLSAASLNACRLSGVLLGSCDLVTISAKSSIISRGVLLRCCCII